MQDEAAYISVQTRSFGGRDWCFVWFRLKSLIDVLVGESVGPKKCVTPLIGQLAYP